MMISAMSERYANNHACRTIDRNRAAGSAYYDLHQLIFDDGPPRTVVM
jgi:hypothetical protein